jgi:hypothetical protein
MMPNEHLLALCARDAHPWRPANGAARIGAFVRLVDVIAYTAAFGVALHARPILRRVRAAVARVGRLF